VPLELKITGTAECPTLDALAIRHLILCRNEVHDAAPRDFIRASESKHPRIGIVARDYLATRVGRKAQHIHRSRRLLDGPRENRT
jgi:hypothetical protein